MMIQKKRFPVRLLQPPPSFTFRSLASLYNQNSIEQLNRGIIEVPAEDN